MPSGYTSRLHDGKEQSFHDFIWDCARAFGALIDMRDAPGDANIPERIEPDNYYVKALAKDEERLKLVVSWNKAEAEQAAEADFKRRLAIHTADLQKANDIRYRYNKMAEEVMLWIPPSNEHVGLKNFMLEQLGDSIKFDCDFTDRMPAPKRLTGSEYRQQEIAEAKRHIGYDIEHLAEEEKRAKERTEWIQLLRKSLKSGSAVK